MGLGAAAHKYNGHYRKDHDRTPLPCHVFRSLASPHRFGQIGMLLAETQKSINL
jgi:hypothetical protein